MFTPEYVYKYARGNAEQSVALPNMVKRYQHHTKVLRNVLEYEKKVRLSDGQRSYYDAILERLLFTQYALGIVYDEDKERGYVRARKFDAYLRRQRYDLYKKTAEKMKMVECARRHNFNYKKVENDPIVKAYNKYLMFSNIFNASIYRVMQTSIGKKVRSTRMVSTLINVVNEKLKHK